MLGLSRKSVDLVYPVAITDPDELPRHVVDRVDPLRPDIELLDYATPLRNGWSWAFAPMAQELPRTFAELESADPRFEYRECIHEDHGERIWWGDLLLRVHDRFVPVIPYFQGDTWEERQARGQSHSLISSLPARVARGYYYRISGVGLVAELPYSSFDLGRLWPCPMETGHGLASAMDEMPDAVRRSAAHALRHVASLEYPDAEQVISGFHVLFDSRAPGVRTRTGEQLLIEVDSREPRIFLVRGWDFATLKVLDDPADWLDQQTCAVLRRMRMV
jgi:hypothetical protein